MRLQARSVRVVVAIAAIAMMLFGAFQIGGASSPGNDPFLRTWARTDKPVADLQVNRTWMWGPQANSPLLLEAYAESPNQQRTVQYYDKSRMEITHPDATDDGIWYVTNGLLSKELITGQLQVGDAAYTNKLPASINVAGDADDANGPTYATFDKVLNAGAIPNGFLVTQRIDRSGKITDDPSLLSYGVTAASRLTVPGIDHQIASPFWDFMHSSGMVYEGGRFVDDAMFQNPYYATGYPITEGYWSTVKVAGVLHNVLIQCFERRCLTYTPDNPDGWKVEAGNVGQHYYAWRYAGSAPTQPVPAPTPTASPSLPPACDASYPTVCIPPPPPQLNCSDIPYTDFQVVPPDPHGFDADHDGIGCETEVAPQPTPTTEPQPPGGGDPPGATARCNDGTYSYSQHRSGTCSHHGGVWYWINPPPD